MGSPGHLLNLTVETKVWEQDWEDLLVGGLLRHVFTPILTPCSRRVIINNVREPGRVLDAARVCIAGGDLDDVVLVDDHIEAALQHFRMSVGDFGEGFVYSRAELVGLLTCESEYLCHFAGDCRMLHHSDWCQRGIELLERSQDVVSVNPVWNGRLQEVHDEEVERRGHYSLGHGFSDQCYLVRADTLRGADIHWLPPATDDPYPEYGGDLFEKRVSAWIRHMGVYRATDLLAAYVHLNA